MVLEQQDSGVCLSTEPGSPMSDDPTEVRSSREDLAVQRRKLKMAGLVEGLKRLETSNGKMEVGGGTGKEASVEREEEVRRKTEEVRGSRLADTMPDLSTEEWAEEKEVEEEEGREKEGRMEEGGGEGGGRGMTGVRCHHHLLLTSEDQENENEPRICPICR